MYVIGMNLGTYYLDKDSATPIDTFSGGSQIVDYSGQVVTEVPCGAGSTWIAGTIDIEALRNFRRPAHRDDWMKDLTTEVELLPERGVSARPGRPAPTVG
jgi:predicted amidohydrolase